MAVGPDEYSGKEIDSTSAGAVSDGASVVSIGAPSANVTISVSSGALVSVGTGISEESVAKTSEGAGALMLWPTESHREMANEMVAIMRMLILEDIRAVCEKGRGREDREEIYFAGQLRCIGR